MESNNSKYMVYRNRDDLVGDNLNLLNTTDDEVRESGQRQLDIRGFRIPINIKDKSKLKDKGEDKFQSIDKWVTD
jgi:hypothetical protein